MLVGGLRKESMQPMQPHLAQTTLHRPRRPAGKARGVRLCAHGSKLHTTCFQPCILCIGAAPQSALLQMGNHTLLLSKSSGPLVITGLAIPLMPRRLDLGCVAGAKAPPGSGHHRNLKQFCMRESGDWGSKSCYDGVEDQGTARSVRSHSNKVSLMGRGQALTPFQSP